MYLQFLREEFDKNEESFASLKKDHRWEHLVELGNAIDNNLDISKNLLSDKEKFGVLRQEDETVFSKQYDLVKAIMLSQDQLRICLNAEHDFACSIAEMDTRYGRVDLVAQDSKTIYPIEVKKNCAFHDVVGQISKYVIHFKLGLVNRIYDFVAGVVIANSFDMFVLKELYKLGIIPIKYKFKTEQQVEFERL
jgi:RecB family endonuclease NucS